MFQINENETDSPDTIMDSSTRYEGTIDSENSLRIEGTFEGTIQCEDTVIIGSTAEIAGIITADVAVIGGHVTGDVRARKRIEIRSSAEIFGDLTAPVMQIDEGVVLKGECTINAGSEDSEKAPVSDIQEQLGS